MFSKCILVLKWACVIFDFTVEKYCTSMSVFLRIHSQEWNDQVKDLGPFPKDFSHSTPSCSMRGLISTHPHQHPILALALFET